MQSQIIDPASAALSRRPSPFRERFCFARPTRAATHGMPPFFRRRKKARCGRFSGGIANVHPGLCDVREGKNAIFPYCYRMSKSRRFCATVIRKQIRGQRLAVTAPRMANIIRQRQTRHHQNPDADRMCPQYHSVTQSYSARRHSTAGRDFSPSKEDPLKFFRLQTRMARPLLH